MNESTVCNRNIDLHKFHLLQNVCSCYRQLAVEKHLFSCLMSTNRHEKDISGINTNHYALRT